MDSAESVRIAENEAMFREINETLVEAEGGPGSIPITCLCECADEFCAVNVVLTAAEYERVRMVAEHFVVAPEHVIPEVEIVVARYPQFWVIRKVGVAGEVAEETDPRADA